MSTALTNTARLALVAAVGALALALSSCTAMPGPPDGSSPSITDAKTPLVQQSPAQATPAWPSTIPAPQTEGAALAHFASAATPGGSSFSGGAFDANGAGLDFNIDCQGAGTITVKVTDSSGDNAPGMSSFDAACEAGKLTSMGNRDYTAHGAISVQVLAPEGIAWAMTVGAVPAGETPPA